MITVCLVQLLLLILTVITTATTTDRPLSNDTVFASNTEDDIDIRIVGGDESVIDEFPYFGTYTSYLYRIVFIYLSQYCDSKAATSPPFPSLARRLFHAVL
jgi:hypothetical protein